MFHILLLEQDTIKKKRVDKNVTELKFDVGNNEEYKVEAIRDNTVYAKELEGHLSGRYYLIAWKAYTRKKNTYKPFSAVQYLRKLFRLFHKNHPKKPTATFLPINSSPLIARPTIKPTRPTKQKQG